MAQAVITSLMMGYKPDPVVQVNETEWLERNINEPHPGMIKSPSFVEKGEDVIIQKGGFVPIIYNGQDLNEVVHIILKALQNVSNVRYYGITMLIDVLSGTVTKKLFNAKLNTVPVFGKLEAISREELRAIIDWLIENNYILKTKGQYPVLHPTYNGMHYNEKMTVDQLKQLKSFLML
jgi:DNA helicase-4